MSVRPSVFFRGMAMGAADVVPGVSGGTLALITGIYEELIDTLGGIGPRLFRIWREQGLTAAWRAGNLTFLVTLLAGMFSSIALLAKLITWLLDAHPVPVWAFFSGLILASILLVLKPLQQRGWRQLTAFGVGTVVAVLIGLAPGIGEVASSVLVFFASGAVAICAMILPGISGSFILLLLGMYQPVLAAVDQGNAALLAAFLAGCATGLLSFVHLLKWLLHHYHDTIMALLAGFMAGSLLKLWPWRLEQEGSLRDSWLTPADYAQATGGSAHLGMALLTATVAVLLVWLLSRAGQVHNVADHSG